MVLGDSVIETALVAGSGAALKHAKLVANVANKSPANGIRPDNFLPKIINNDS